MARVSRKQLINDWLASLGDVCVTETELRALQRQLTPILGQAKPPTLPKLAELVFDAGGRVCYGEFGGGPEDRVLSLESLDLLEERLRVLHGYLLAAQSVTDRAGVERARQAARRARRLALWVARNSRVAPHKREVKQEMADWLLLWLEMPDAFFEWLVLRKRTAEYHALHSPAGG